MIPRFDFKVIYLDYLKFVYRFACMEKFILKLAQKCNPQIPFDDYRTALTSQKLDESIIKSIFNKIKPDPKKSNSEILFAASVLLLFSPKSILLSEKVENGICFTIKKNLGINQQSASYRIKVAREVYQVDKVFRSQVDKIVKEVCDE